MRYLLFATLLLFLFTQLSCTYTNLGEANLQDPEPVLEVWSEVGGLIEPSGRFLFLRMYSDGLVECEVRDHRKVMEGRPKRIEDTVVLKQAYLGAGKRSAILELLSNSEIPNLKSSYYQQSGTDTFLNLYISVNHNGLEKNLRINGYDLERMKLTEHPTREVLPRLIADLVTEADIARIN